MDLEALRHEVERELEASWDELVDGAKDDVARFSERISLNLTYAIASGDTARVDEIRAQAATLAKSHRVRLNEAAWDLVLKGVKLTVTALGN